MCDRFTSVCRSPATAADGGMLVGGAREYEEGNGSHVPRARQRENKENKDNKSQRNCLKGDKFSFPRSDYIIIVGKYVRVYYD